MNKTIKPFLKHFGEITDPRIERSRVHSLTDIIAISICAVLSGVDTVEGIEIFARGKEQWLRSFLDLEGGIPSHDTIGELLKRIQPGQFEAAFVKWMTEVEENLPDRLIAVDGKTLRRSMNKSKSRSPVHMVSAWAVENGVVLGQRSVEAKTNEISAIPELLDSLVITGCIVTIDAMGCQRAICEKILEKSSDYCISLKGNQESLKNDVTDYFEFFSPQIAKPAMCDATKTTEKSHGRSERRDYFITDDIAELKEKHDWPGLKSIGLVRTNRQIKGKADYEDRYFICSFPANAEKFARAVRGHWGVENGLHWVLDVTFQEDSSRMREEALAENFSRLRRIAVNVLKRQPGRGTISKRRIRCAYDDNYRSQVLATGLL